MWVIVAGFATVLARFLGRRGLCCATLIWKDRAMPVLDSQLNSRSADFLANASAMQTLVTDLNARLEQVALGGGEAARAKHTAPRQVAAA